MNLVTGATGLLGSHLLVELTLREEKIRALKRKTSDLVQVKNLFSHYFGVKAEEKFNQIEWVEGDILDIVSLEKAIKDCDKVFHCAALVSFRKKDFHSLIRTNKIGTSNVVNVCLNSTVKQICYVSSTAALGRDESKQYYDENNKWSTSTSNSGYAVSKYLAENEVWRGVEEGLPAVIINPSVILGPGNWNESSLSIFKAIKNGLKFYTNGTNGFVDARDVAFILSELSEQNVTNERFVVVGENSSYKQLFNLIAKSFQIKGPIIEAKPWMAAIAWRVEGILHFLFGKKQNITKETAKSSLATNIYKNDKVVSRLNFQFKPMNECVQNAITFFEKYKS